MTTLEEEAEVAKEASRDVQRGTLLDFHKQLGHLNYGSVEKFVRDPSSDRIGGVICSDLKAPMTPRDMVNFVDNKSNYVRVFLARSNDQAAKKFKQFLVFSEKEFNCENSILRTDLGGEYQNVDLFCRDTNVARQRSEANNQTRNGKAERMHRTVMNIARCMVFACGLPLSFWGVTVPTKQTPQLGKIVVFGSPYTVYRDPSNKNFSHRAQQGIGVVIGEKVKGYRVYLPKDNKVVTSQHVRDIETLKKTPNLQVQNLYRGEDEA
ncbi:unnamed protein product [Phytophthora fragariaefolia]|uniref:Unnamed protein product n=1 Tax=Phytophthora fragariaefolia TaxID=1490495 RepID=A0A9W7CN40_9STRA|nr:unnamed protein product [Phytophthora fragariaefolia]